MQIGAISQEWRSAERAVTMFLAAPMSAEASLCKQYVIGAAPLELMCLCPGLAILHNMPPWTKSCTCYWCSDDHKLLAESLECTTMVRNSMAA